MGGSPSVTLQECEGDCDNNGNCATGLTCFQRDTFIPIPGCKNGGAGDVYGYDYCYDINASVGD